MHMELNGDPSGFGGKRSDRTDATAREGEVSHWATQPLGAALKPPALEPSKLEVLATAWFLKPRLHEARPLHEPFPHGRVLESCHFENVAREGTGRQLLSFFLRASINHRPA